MENKSENHFLREAAIAKEANNIMKEALIIKEDSIRMLEKALERESKVQLLSNKEYVKFLIKKEQITVLKGLLTASHGQSEIFGLAPDVTSNPVYNEEETYHIKDKIQKIIDTF